MHFQKILNTNMHVQTQKAVLGFKRSDSGREHRRIGFYKFSCSGGLAQINNKRVIQVHKPKRHELFMVSVSVTKRVFFRVFFLTTARTAVVAHKGQTGLWS